MSVAEISIKRPITTIMLFVSMFVIGLIAAVAHEIHGDHKSAAYWARHASSRRPGASVGRFFKAFPFSDPALRRSISDALKRTGIPEG